MITQEELENEIALYECGKVSEVVVNKAVHSHATKNGDAFSIEWWSVDRLKPYERNARKITKKAVEKVAQSLAAFGWRQPIVVEPDGTIIVGHTRRLAAMKRGDVSVPVHVARGLSKDQIKAYRLMDNRSHEESAWDDDLLKIELSDLKMSNALDSSGFSTEDLDKLLGESKSALPVLGSFEYRVVIKCENEQQQAEMLEKLTAQGIKCQALIS